ncbi:MAG: hypothetical protein ACFCUU_12740 [Cyclobacteriaceae bacterium]
MAENSSSSILNSDFLESLNIEDGVVLKGQNGKIYPSIESAKSDGVTKIEILEINAEEKKKEINEKLFGTTKVGSEQIKSVFQLLLYVKSQVTATQVSSAVGTLGYSVEINKIGQKKRGRKKGDTKS